MVSVTRSMVETTEENMNIIGTGLSGLIGSRVVELLSPEYIFENLSLETGVDITQKEVVDSRISSSAAPWVFHFAAKTDVDGAELEKDLGPESQAWRVNVAATKHLVDACRTKGKRLLYISTDFVFDGTKDIYVEDDAPSPQGWYAKTKYEGERLVQALGEQGLIIRTAFPYRAKNEHKRDFVHRMLDVLSSGKVLSAPSDQIFVPTFIDDIAVALRSLVNNNASGIYNVVGSQALSPHQAGSGIAETFGYPIDLVVPTSFASYYAGRAPRPFHANLSNAKIAKFGVKMLTFEEGLSKIRLQTSNLQL